ncbi:MAG: asparaginase, partial [Ruminiclostridium sp.]|nr:asparaginase [Ruminiclostridium sp.]
MKLLFIFTGGTIGSTVNGDIISTDNKKPYLILEKYCDIYGLNFEYDILQPYTELSENNTGATIRKLIGTVLENLSKGYDGMIITHGTDTIQYSAAVLSYTVKTDIPLCLVSSNYTIENPKANGLVNLHCAVRFMESVKTAGVWVSYKNQNDIPRIHKGSRLLERQAFTDCIFSVMDSYYGSFDGD